MTNRYIRVEEIRRLAKSAGWGRIHVNRAKKDAAIYLAKYLSKEREPCLKRWRLWAGFGNWDWSKVKDISVESPHSTVWKACVEAFDWKVKGGFAEKRSMVDWLYRRTIEEGWTLGFGPQGRKYDECLPRELTG